MGRRPRASARPMRGPWHAIRTEIQNHGLRLRLRDITQTVGILGFGNRHGRSYPPPVGRDGSRHRDARWGGPSANARREENRIRFKEDTRIERTRIGQVEALEPPWRAHGGGGGRRAVPSFIRGFE